MKKPLIVIFILLSLTCSAQTEKELREGFPGADFDYFNRGEINVNKNGKSIMMLGLVADSVFVYYLTSRKVEMVELYSRYRYPYQIERGSFYFIENVQGHWIATSKKITAAYLYIGNIKDIELATEGYLYELLLAEHTNKKEFTLIEIVNY